MTTDDLYNDPILPAAEEREALAVLQAFLESDHGDGLALLGSDGEHAQLPSSVVRLLRRGVAVLSDERAISAQPIGLKISVEQASRILQLPLAAVFDMVNRQEIASSRDDDMLWVNLEDVLSQLADLRRQRRDALDEMTRLSQEMGLYEVQKT